MHSLIYEAVQHEGFPVSDGYRRLVEHFFDDDFALLLAAYRSANLRMMSDAGALIVRFSKHAETELEGGEIIAAIGAEAPDGIGAAIVAHGLDEQRHHRMFKAMAERVADDFGIEHFPLKYRDPAPTIRNLSGTDAWKYLIVSIHWAEVRNLFILDNYLEALGRVDWRCTPLLIKQIKAVQADEIRHVGYTAKYIADIIADPAFVDIAHEYKQSYLANCWKEIGEMAHYFATHERIDG